MNNSAPSGTLRTFHMPNRSKSEVIFSWSLSDGDELRHEDDFGVIHNDDALREVISAERFLQQLTKTEAHN